MSSISLRDYDRPHTSPLLRHSNSQLLFVPIIHCDGEGCISTAKGLTGGGAAGSHGAFTGHKKVLGPWICVHRVKQRGLSPFWDTWCCCCFGFLSVCNGVLCINGAGRNKASLQRGFSFWLFSTACSDFLFAHKPERFQNPLNLILRCSCPIHPHRHWICQPAVS